MQKQRKSHAAALTGHLVLSTLHTNDAPSAITRLIDMGIKPFLIATSLQGVMAQRLVRVICPNCKEPVKYTPEQLINMGFEIEVLKDFTFTKEKVAGTAITLSTSAELVYTNY